MHFGLATEAGVLSAPRVEGTHRSDYGAAPYQSASGKIVEHRWEGLTGALRLGVVGAGHFGRYHAQKMAALDGACLVAVADIDADRAAAVADPLGADAVADHHELIGRVDAVSVAVPAAAHYPVVKDFLDAGIHVLVEKPFTETVVTAEELATLAEAKGLVLQVGLIERFSDAFRTVTPRVTRPVYIESVRISPFSERGTDVSVVLDLMIHDIDIILALVDSPVADVDAVGAPVFSSSEDIANARLKFANGCIANVTASRVSLKTERALRIFQPDVYIKVDHGERSVRIARRKEGDPPPTGPGRRGVGDPPLRAGGPASARDRIVCADGQDRRRAGSHRRRRRALARDCPTHRRQHRREPGEAGPRLIGGRVGRATPPRRGRGLRRAAARSRPRPWTAAARR